MTLHLASASLAPRGEVYLDDVNLELHPGRIYTVIGRTLAGKTSLLRTLAGLERLDAGTTTLDGKDLGVVPVWRRDSAMVYQQFINYPQWSVYDNIAFPLRRAKLSPEEVRSRTEEAISKVGLIGLEHRKPSQLSGGQQQRVALARALARRTRILLLDEPLVNLDFKLREQLRDEFRDLFSGVGDSIVVYTTTEPAEALSLGDEVIVMHEGRIVQMGSPNDVFERPRSTHVAAVVNDPPMNLMRALVDDEAVHIDGLPPLPVPDHLHSLEGVEIQLGLRASDLVVDGKGLINGNITFIEISGSETFVHVAVGPLSVVAQLEGIHDAHLGDPIRLAIRADRLFAFDAIGALLVAPGAAAGDTERN